MNKQLQIMWGCHQTFLKLSGELETLWLSSNNSGEIEGIEQNKL